MTSWYIYPDNWTPFSGGNPSLKHALTALALPQDQAMLLWMLYGRIPRSGSFRRSCRDGPHQIASIWDWPTPKIVIKVQSFVGFAHFYHRLIPNFSHVASPLHHLTKKEPLQWMESKETAFWELKTLVTSAPVLILPNQDAHFQLETDASSYATWATLSQLCDDEKWHPVGFMSKSLSPAECNYTIYNKELLLVICRLKEWRHIL